MKRIIAFALCVGFLFALTGCKKKSPEEIEQQISQQLSEAKYMDTHVTGDISMNIPDAGVQKITIDADYKMDISSGFPKMLFDGSVGLAGVMSFPMSFYMDETTAAISVLGQAEETPISEENKAQIQTIFGQNGIKTNFNKTVTATKYNEQNALEIVYDTSTLNQLMAYSGSEDVSINSLTGYYLLIGNNQLDTMVIKMSVTSEGEQMEMNLSIKFNSIGQPIEITPIEREGTTEPTFGTDRTLDILTQNAA